MAVDDRDWGGPYLQAAVFCEKVLQEKDGVLSVVRMVDRLIITASGVETPERLSDLPPANLSIMGVLSFKSGIAKGSFTVTVRGKTPS